MYCSPLFYGWKENCPEYTLQEIWEERGREEWLDRQISGEKQLCDQEKIPGFKGGKGGDN